MAVQNHGPFSVVTVDATQYPYVDILDCADTGDHPQTPFSPNAKHVRTRDSKVR
jgi:hypothetical protein